MADQGLPERRSGGLMRPVISAIVVIAVVVAVIAFRTEVWDFLQWLGRSVGNFLTDWIPDHQGQFAAIIGFAIVAFVLNWLAHVRGRLRAWVFAVVLELGLWLLFWQGPGIPSLNELFGLDIAPMSFVAALVSGLVVIAITGLIFWFLEMREEWRKYRRQHTVDVD